MGLVSVRLSCVARRSLTVFVCALAGHAAAYGSLLPHDAAHGYLGGYEIAVAAASGAALAVMAVSLVGLLTGRLRPLRALGLPERSTLQSSRRAVSLGVGAVALLVVQESLEALVAPGPKDLAGGSAGRWLIAILVTALCAVVLTTLGHSCAELIRGLVAEGGRLRRPVATAITVRRVRRRHTNPLAQFRGLRAPPPLLS
jgi:hypothetical protein